MRIVKSEYILNWLGKFHCAILVKHINNEVISAVIIGKMTAPTSNHFRLMDLPLELRQKIFDHAICKPIPKDWDILRWSTFASIFRQPAYATDRALLSVSKQVRAEMVFVIRQQQGGFEAFTDFVQEDAKLEGLRKRMSEFCSCPVSTVFFTSSIFPGQLRAEDGYLKEQVPLDERVWMVKYWIGCSVNPYAWQLRIKKCEGQQVERSASDVESPTPGCRI
ncbi:hypothetical protein NA57DRAFT_53509 [Rhizodiscina lignyota]|uniref:F-box domain-containing protein n=1 Tax=Rhizodiscina lignyota TaxID=1504668 RepID=A0A9P4INA1_9PEZI|nr:hypothetical protein NA57DRAFT_53509 [Rhizodiscina lignyota]